MEPAVNLLVSCWLYWFQQGAYWFSAGSSKVPTGSYWFADGPSKLPAGCTGSSSVPTGFLLVPVGCLLVLYWDQYPVCWLYWYQQDACWFSVLVQAGYWFHPGMLLGPLGNTGRFSAAWTDYSGGPLRGFLRTLTSRNIQSWGLYLLIITKTLLYLKVVCQYIEQLRCSIEKYDVETVYTGFKKQKSREFKAVSWVFEGLKKISKEYFCGCSAFQHSD